MRVVVPFAAEQPKTRLGDCFTLPERRAFARAMLRDVLAALRETGHTPEVLSTAPVALDAPTTIDERPLTAAVNAVLDTSSPVAVVMADLPLATSEALSRLFSATGDVVLAPGRGGGTNALVARHPDFRVAYHGASYLDHTARARAVGASVTTVDSFRLATDIDERADLVEILVHGNGAAREWLASRLELARNTDGRVTVSRTDGPSDG